ncbi:MAG: aminotransferase class V-fold PLP-dependent enzyme [Chloroflexi bacterium]|nr:aminotransferase class V-fold PLP-dependent enzyme [Chloroflexota bacterium]
MKSLHALYLLDPDIIFLNHGSFGATPRQVFQSYQRWQRKLERQPVEFLGRCASEYLLASRTVLAEYLGTARDNLVYVTNATTGINIVARSLALGPGDEVLSTNHEYGAMDRTWRFLAQKQGFCYINRSLPLPFTSTEEFVSAFWEGVTPQTRVIYISHITSPTAIIFPVREICARARHEGILTVVDGAHAPGQIPLDLDALGCDFYSGNLHKWLCAPKGSAFLFARPEVQHLIEPLIVSWGWQSDHPGSSRFNDYLEWTGTRDIAAFLAVPEAIAFQVEHDWDAVRLACHKLAAAARQGIQALTGLPALCPDSPLWYAQMGSALLPNSIDADLLKSQLYDLYRIEIPVVQWEDKTLLRFSFQGYNRRSDLDALLVALQKLLP